MRTFIRFIVILISSLCLCCNANEVDPEFQGWNDWSGSNLVGIYQTVTITQNIYSQGKKTTRDLGTAKKYIEIKESQSFITSENFPGDGLYSVSIYANKIHFSLQRGDNVHYSFSRPEVSATQLVFKAYSYQGADYFTEMVYTVTK